MPLDAPGGRTRPGPPAPGHRAVTGVLSGLSALRIHLQPVVDLSTGSFWGAEALARFPGDPEVGPAAWFEAALHDGRGPALEALALRAALRLLPALPADLRLTVNLSATALLTPSVAAQLVDAGGPRLVVELTEDELVEVDPALLAVLADVRATGTALGIDDFGAGHSSWRHVLRLAPEVIKLDMSLVQDVAASPQRQALVAAMVAFCGRTDTVLIAEGIEVPADLRALMDLGVGHAQGWYLARPADPAVVLPALAETDVIVLPG